MSNDYIGTALRGATIRIESRGCGGRPWYVVALGRRWGGSYRTKAQARDFLRRHGLRETE